MSHISKVGPWGRRDGVRFEEELPEGLIVRAVSIFTDPYVRGIQLDVELDPESDDSEILSLPVNGNSNGTKHVFALEKGEFVTGINGRGAWFLDAIRITTNRRKSRWYGGPGGNPFSLFVPPETALTSFFGSFDGEFLCSIGLNFGPVSDWMRAEMMSLAPETSAVDGGPSTATPTISITNFAQNEAIFYSHPILKGKISNGPPPDHPITSIRLSASGSNGEPHHSQVWPVIENQFKCVAPLLPGMNQISLEVLGQDGLAGISQKLSLCYVPSGNQKKVRFVFVISRDSKCDDPSQTEQAVMAPLRTILAHTTRSTFGLDCSTSSQSAKDRIALGGLLMQSFTAEKMWEQGFGRMTFDFEPELHTSRRPKVHVFRSNLTTAAARSMEGGALWSHFAGELAKSLPQEERSNTIDVVIMGMSGYDGAQKRTFASTALGGGHLALFGSPCLHTWASSLHELVYRFTDTTAINTNECADDSCGRGAHWSNYSTTLGATLHELGHCLGLPHPRNHIGIMARGFDHFNRAFMAVEPHTHFKQDTPHSFFFDPLSHNASFPAQIDRDSFFLVDDGMECGWDRANAVRLRFNPWLYQTSFLKSISSSPPRDVAFPSTDALVAVPSCSPAPIPPSEHGSTSGPVKTEKSEVSPRAMLTFSGPVFSIPFGPDPMTISTKFKEQNESQTPSSSVAIPSQISVLTDLPLTPLSSHVEALSSQRPPIVTLEPLSNFGSSVGSLSDELKQKLSISATVLPLQCVSIVCDSGLRYIAYHIDYEVDKHEEFCEDLSVAAVDGHPRHNAPLKPSRVALGFSPAPSHAALPPTRYIIPICPSFWSTFAPNVTKVSLAATDGLGRESSVEVTKAK